MKKQYSGFTLVELLVGLVFISIGLLSIIGLMRSSIAYTDKTRQETLAINLAREGMESVYTIRNTNWLRWAGKKDENRLCINPGINNPSDTTSCGVWMESGISYLLSFQSDQQYVFLKKRTGRLDLSDGIDTGFTLEYSPTFVGRGSGWHQVPNSTLTNNEGRFFREIRGLGLFQKDSNIIGGNPITCTQGTGMYTAITITGASLPNQPCSDSRPKEFRFCSKVEYQKQMKGKVELCGVLTNYEE